MSLSMRTFNSGPLPIPARLILGLAIMAMGWKTIAGDPPRHGWRLACRLASYGKFQEVAWNHLPSLGVQYVFLSVPEPSDVTAIQERLERHHLKPLVMRGHADLGEPESLVEIANQLATCQRMGVRYLFLSPRHKGLSKEDAYQWLRKAGEIASRHDVILTLETHPDLGANAAEHLETMRRVNHPNVKVNFDTGNITYYNEDADVVAELRRVIDHVATVELKDHNGRPGVSHFPAIGQGKIDMPGVLGILKEHNFNGPITIEVEGIAGKPWDEAQTKQAIADSVAYLKRIGALD